MTNIYIMEIFPKFPPDVYMHHNAAFFKTMCAYIYIYTYNIYLFKTC